MDDEIFKLYEHNKQFSGKKNPLKRQPACYLIAHAETEKVYVGSTNDLSRRSTENLKALRNNKHKNKKLQESYNGSPEIVIVYHPCNDPDEALVLEQKIVDSLKQTDLLFNVATQSVALTRQGAKLTQEHIQILINSNINKTVTEDSRIKMRESQQKFFSSEQGEQRKKEIQKQFGKEVTIDGKVYPSINEASRLLNIPYTTLSRKLSRSSS